MILRALEDKIERIEASGEEKIKQRVKN